LPKNWKGDSVTANNEQGAYDATRCLIELGHRRLATITGPLHLTNAHERLSGFKRAAREAKLSVNPEYVQETTFDKRGGYAKTLILLRLIPRPTAIFAGNDMIALGTFLAIREFGLSCPRDISICGFDDLDLGETTDPALTSVSQSGYQLGATAARILLDRIQGDKSSAKHIVLETSLDLRNSVAHPPRDTGSARSLRRKPPRDAGKRRTLLGE
jgi:LacI family transcriptional regulator